MGPPIHEGIQKIEGADLAPSICVVLPGFEPRQAEPKTAVLPLHHKTIIFAQAFCLKRCKVTHCFEIVQMKLSLFQRLCTFSVLRRLPLGWFMRHWVESRRGVSGG